MHLTKICTPLFIKLNIFSKKRKIFVMSFISISDGTIEEISTERKTTFVTITYSEGAGNRRNEQTVRLVVTPRTIILGTNRTPVHVTALRVGMTVNAVFSTVMTRSIPPQSDAYIIQIVSRPRPEPENMTTGRILDIDRRNRSFTTISDRDLSSIIRFNVADNARIIDRLGRNMEFSRLSSGMRVRVRHADFMTASIPPQTTAFEIRVL